MRCLIISGGEFSKVKLNKKYDLVIACDKGYLHAKKMKIKPDIIVGDFDSAKMPKDKTTIIAVSPIKDDTDTGLAVKYALRNGYKDIDIICALGGRVDHSIANITELLFIDKNGAKGTIYSSDTTVTVLNEGLNRLNGGKNEVLSLFSLTKTTKLKFMKGTKYDGENICLKNDFPLGVSNEFVKTEAQVHIVKGKLLCIKTMLQI